MRKQTLFKSENITLEKITFEVGFNLITTYREINCNGTELSVKEWEELPKWYIRELKLKELLNK